MGMNIVTIKPIRTEADLRQAKHRLVEMLRDNVSGKHDDEIEVLSTLAETFENNHSRVDAPTPTGAIKFRMEELGLTPRQLEPFIGTRARVSEVLSGKRLLSIDMIRALHEGLGIPYSSLLTERSRTNNANQVSGPVLDRLNTLGFNVERGSVPSFITSTLNNEAPLALLRKTRTQRASSKTDQGALLLWQAAVLQKGDLARPSEPFVYEKFCSKDFRHLARMSQRSDGPIRAIVELSRNGVSVVVLPALPGTFLDGVAMLTPTGMPVIGLTLRHDRIDGFWFTLLHEVSHIALHYQILKKNKEAFVDDMEIRSEDVCEREADELARNILIPPQFLAQVNWGPYITQDEIISIATRARVHIAIVAGRWQREHQNYKRFSRLIQRDTLRPMLLPGKSKVGY
jgi:HTH-type transcriptional regulator/antitoxin HigA